LFQINLPWEKKGSKTEKKPAKSALKGDAVSTVGALQHYIVDEELDWQYKATWG